MEQAAGPVNWRGVNHPKPRGLNRLWSLQAVARGADAVCYFQWRQSRQGAEKFHSGMVSHAGERGRTFQEVKQIGAELALISDEVTGSHIKADIAILHDWNSWWAGAQDGRLSTEVDYPQVVRAWHRALWEAHLTTAFAHPEHDLSAYKLVVVPQLYLLTDTAIDNLLAYVRGGHPRQRLPHRRRRRGRPGAPGRNGRAAARAVRHPHPARVVAAGRGGGRRVRGLPRDAVVRGDRGRGRRDRGRVQGWRAGRAAGGTPQGQRAVPVHLPEPAALRDLLADAADSVGVRPVLEGIPAGVEAVRRGELLFLLNHGRDEVTVEVPGTHRDLLTSGSVTGSVRLERYGAAVLAP